MKTTNNISNAAVGIALSLLPAITFANQGFIQADNRADIAFDVSKSVLYISGTSEIRRFDMNSNSFLNPIALGGTTLGMDISPDGNTLAVANSDYSNGKNYIDLINLQSGTSSRVSFDQSFYEGGTFAVAYDSQSKLLITSQFQGSGWAPLRQYDSATDTTSTLGSIRQDSMVSASANNQVIAIAESNISDGRWGYYLTGDTNYVSQHQYYDPITGGTGGFNFEIATSPDGSQFSVLASGRAYIGDATSVSPLIAGANPVGAAYNPVNGNLFLPFAGTNDVAEYNSQTLQELNRYTAPNEFVWTGNNAFGNGRTKISDDGSYLFTTNGNGVFYSSIAAVPEPAEFLQLGLGLTLLFFRLRKNQA